MNPEPTACPVPTRVLVVDDDPDGLAMMCRLLQAHGLAVETACDGVRALDALRGTPFDLVLLDVMMPSMTGIEVLNRIRADVRHAHVPVILVTARDGDADLLEGYRLGADYYIPKPFTPQQLLHGVSMVLGRALTA